MTKTFLVLGSTILVVALAGCGRGNGSSSGAGPSADPQDQGVKFAQCMRQHGIPMEDPKPGGGVTLGVTKENEAKMKAAQKACADKGGTLKLQKNGDVQYLDDYACEKK